MKNMLKRIKNYALANLARNIGRKKYHCTICNSNCSFFLSTGVKDSVFDKKNVVDAGYRKNVRCPICGAIDRDRWIDYCLDKFTDLYRRPYDVLHIAPEKSVYAKLRSASKEKYITGDITPGRADSVVYVTNMQFEIGSFNYIIMNQVLEHIKDERAALKEVYRCLKWGGILYSLSRYAWI